MKAMEKAAFPVLARKMEERALTNRIISDALNITPRSFYNKITGASEFTWREVVKMQSAFFPDVDKDTLMTRREGA